MPIHDWTWVTSGKFHDFHGAWITHIKEALNRGLLPRGYFAMQEQHAGNIVPDVLTLTSPEWTDADTSETGANVPQGAPALAEAFIEPVQVGQHLPDMPVFLDSNWHVNVPLEATYEMAWQGLPPPYRKILEAN